MENSLSLQKFVTLYIGDRRFYLPLAPLNIYYNNNGFEIQFDNWDSYVIVDGIRCYYHLQYSADKDIIHTHLRDFEFDDLPWRDDHDFSFPLTAKSFPFSKTDARVVVPKRNYAEVTSAFLAEKRNLDEMLIEFLEKHPEVFDQVDITIWEKLSKQLSLLKENQAPDPYVLERYLTKPVADLFKAEMLS